jgi:hypothetical protein
MLADVETNEPLRGIYQISIRVYERAGVVIGFLAVAFHFAGMTSFNVQTTLLRAHPLKRGGPFWPGVAIKRTI